MNNYNPIALCNTKDYTEEQWLIMRTGAFHGIPCTIGGSDASIVLDQNPWITSQELYDRKSGIKVHKKNSNKLNKKLGKIAEKFVQELFILWFEENYKIKLKICSSIEEFNSVENGIYNDTIFYQCGNPDYGFAVANIDGLIKIYGRIGIMEYKTTTSSGKIGKKVTSDWKEKRPPIYYVTQCRHYMGVLNLSYAFLVCAWELNISSGFSANYIERDLEEEKILFQTEKEFVTSVLKKTPWNGTCNSTLLASYYSLKYGNESIDSPTITLGKEYFSLLERFVERTSQKEKLKEKLEEIESIDDELISILLPIIGDANLIVCKKGNQIINLEIIKSKERFMTHTLNNQSIADSAGFDLVSFMQNEPLLLNQYTTNVIDLKKLKLEQPQLFKRYQRQPMPTGEKSKFVATIKTL